MSTAEITEAPIVPAGRWRYWLAQNLPLLLSFAILVGLTSVYVGLFHGQPRARAFRRHLAENAHLDGASVEVLHVARRIAAGETYSAIAAE